MKLTQEQIEEIVQEWIKSKPLVFVQHDVGDRFTVYQDGQPIQGLQGIIIRAGIDDCTTHEVDYLTGRTKQQGDE